MTMIQTKLTSGNITLITFLPVDKRVRVGSTISLEDNPRKWKVKEQWTKMEMEDINQGWTSWKLLAGKFIKS